MSAPAHRGVEKPPATKEGNVKLRNYHLVTEHLCTYTGDIHNSPDKKIVSKFDVWSCMSQRDKILELLRPEDPGKDALEAIVRAVPRRGLVRPYDEDTKRFLQRALLTPSPPDANQTESSEPTSRSAEKYEKSSLNQHNNTNSLKKERSLADELREAEEDERSGAKIRRELLREFRKRGGGVRESMERDRLGKLALAVEEDEEFEECGLSAAARRLDALLLESRSLHEELACIHQDMQVLARRLARRDH